MNRVVSATADPLLPKRRLKLCHLTSVNHAQDSGAHGLGSRGNPQGDSNIDRRSPRGVQSATRGPTRRVCTPALRHDDDGENPTIGGASRQRCSAATRRKDHRQDSGRARLLHGVAVRAPGRSDQACPGLVAPGERREGFEILGSEHSSTIISSAVFP